MKTPKIGICLVLLLFTASCQQNNKVRDAQDPTADQLRETLKAFNNAFATSDLATLDSLTTQNYLHTNSSSQVIGKSAWFNYLKKRDGNVKSGTVEVLEYVLEDPKIEMHHKMAIVTGKVKVVTKDSLGLHRNAYRVTNIWIHDEGKWKRAGFHDGKIK